MKEVIRHRPQTETTTTPRTMIAMKVVINLCPQAVITTHPRNMAES